MQQQVDAESVIAQSFEEDIADFKSDKALKHVNSMIKEWKAEREADALFNEEELWRILYE